MRFWRSLTRTTTVSRLTRDLYAYRLRRWTGRQDGSPNPEKERQLRAGLGRCSDAERRAIRAAFGRSITHIVNGYYLLNALPAPALAELMRRIASACGRAGAAGGNLLRLSFNAGYRGGEPASTRMLVRLIRALAGAESSATLRIGPDGGGACRPTIVADTRSLRS